MSGIAEFGLLGPLLVRSGGVEVPIRRGHQRTLLALLLLQANHVVPAEEITEVLWGPAPPASAPVAIRSYIRGLRRALGQADRQRISTQPRGYLIGVADGELDVARFERLLASARAASRGGSWQQAAEQARQALSCWRGEPLEDIESQAMALRDAPRLAELRLQATETRIEADLRLGGHGEVIAELPGLCAAHPLREQLHGLLMRALYQCGRQAEALNAYQHARDVLVTELGVEPGPGLRELHHQILSADPVLTVTGPTQPAHAEHQPDTPRQLPSAVPGFTGRAAELKTLTQILDQADAGAPGTVVISAIGGTAGVGKTALALFWAHQVADLFPDGQLHVNLRGYDPGPPVPAADVLAGFLRCLGVPGQDIPPGENERAARYRSLLAGKQMLVVLDNAGSAEQVRPLLPGTAACVVVVTSRDALAGLVARDGAARLDLDVLPLPEAVALLRALIGDRVDIEPAAAAELAGQCCRLPLALRVAAELAATRPATPLSALVSELADLRTRLDLLEAGGDSRTDVRAVFSWSCRHLDAADFRAFRLLGLHPGPDFGPYAAAALIGATVPQVRRALDTLARAHLIQPASPGRYGMHDLLRGYARELASDQDGEQETRPALTRLFDHYLHAAATAMDTLFPAERRHRPRIPRPTTPVPPFVDAAAARDWLEAERATLVAAAGYAAAYGWPGHPTRLASTLARYLYSGGHFADALTIYGHALGAARRTGDRAAQAAALTQIGSIHWRQSRLRQAADCHRQALALSRAAGDRYGQARALTNLGLAEKDLGRYQQAARHHQEAVATFRDIGDHSGEARALGNLGLVRQRQGRCQEAADYHQQVLDLSREIGDRQCEATALGRLGVVDLQLGRYQDAAGYLQQALALSRENGAIIDESEILAKLGEVYLGLGRYEQAVGNFEQVLATAREIGNAGLEADALDGLGEVLLRQGDAHKARAHHATALRLASEADSPREQARAHSGLARACQAAGDLPQARHHWEQALARYTAIGAPEADEIRARLASSNVGLDPIPLNGLVSLTVRGGSPRGRRLPGHRPVLSLYRHCAARPAGTRERGRPRRRPTGRRHPAGRTVEGHRRHAKPGRGGLPGREPVPGARRGRRRPAGVRPRLCPSPRPTSSALRERRRSRSSWSSLPSAWRSPWRSHRRSSPRSARRG